MLGMMLTGCGDNKEVTKTDDTKVEITTEKESEATETVVEETTEVTTEAPVEKLHLISLQRMVLQSHQTEQ